MSLNCIIKHIKERLFNEQGAGTVEYVIVVLVAIVIGGGLLAFGNQVSGQVTKTGDGISSWFSKANGTGGGNAGGIQQKHGQVPPICEWSLSVAIPIWTNALSFSSETSHRMMK